MEHRYQNNHKQEAWQGEGLKAVEEHPQERLENDEW
jgi:hypothetical protein